MSVDNDLLTFEGSPRLSPHSAVVRDDEEVLVTANRSRNAMPDPEWEIRGYDVRGQGITFSADSVEKADLAAVFVEIFEDDDLTPTENSIFPLREGVPVAVATDGKPALAAWLRVHDHTQVEIAELLSVGDRTVIEYLSRFRSRGTGIPEDVDAPAVGSLMPELPSSMDYSGGEGE